MKHFSEEDAAEGSGDASIQLQGDPSPRHVAAQTPDHWAYTSPKPRMKQRAHPHKKGEYPPMGGLNSFKNTAMLKLKLAHGKSQRQFPAT